VLPALDDLLEACHGFSVPLRLPFRGVDHREGLLLEGPAGWGEFAPFLEYDALESARWLAAAIEAAWQGWPSPVRDEIPVNAIVPAVSPTIAEGLVRESGCSTVKVKVAAANLTLEDDVGRVDAVRSAVGPSGKIRIDANGAWSTDEAIKAIAALAHCGLEYVEQPCATIAECAELRRRVAVPIAIDEGIRRAADPQHVAGVRDAADVLIVKVAPLGGVATAQDVVDCYGLPAVVSSALDTSIGLAAGVALAASLPDLPYACGLGSGLLLRADVVEHRIVPSSGSITPVAPIPDADSLSAVAVSSAQMAGWRARLTDAYHVLAKRPDVEQGGAQ